MLIRMGHYEGNLEHLCHSVAETDAFLPARTSTQG